MIDPKDLVIRIFTNGVGDSSMTIYHPPSQILVGKEIKPFHSQHKVREELLAEIEQKIAAKIRA